MVAEFLEDDDNGDSQNTSRYTTYMEIPGTRTPLFMCTQDGKKSPQPTLDALLLLNVQQLWNDRQLLHDQQLPGEYQQLYVQQPLKI